MAEYKIIDLSTKDFTLSDYDNVRITMPAKPVLSIEEIDDEIRGYVLSLGNKHLSGLSELDDDFVKENLGDQGFETLEEVRQAIVDEFERSVDFARSDEKYQKCCQVLLDRLQGEIPMDVIENNVKAIREGNLIRLEEMRMTLDQYLREEHLNMDQYDRKIREEALYQAKLNVALDLYAIVLGTQVGNHEITEFLSAPDPAAFLAEIREKGVVEEARLAARRVKVMRRVVDTAIVTIEGEEAKPAQPVIEEEDDEDFVMPDFEEMPNPNITNADQFSFSVVSTNE